jgi:hypothetical protein
MKWHEVVDLLELAPAVLVELAVAGQDVQFLEQFDRLPGLISGIADKRFPDAGGDGNAILALCRRLCAGASLAEAVG